jgi:hypothetical protein
MQQQALAFGDGFSYETDQPLERAAWLGLEGTDCVRIWDWRSDTDHGDSILCQIPLIRTDNILWFRLIVGSEQE